MNSVNEITDEDFVPFLNNLGVDTYKKSFEWMLNEPNFSDVLRWIYTNLDENNALTAREECRYKEIEKKTGLLSSKELEDNILKIQQEYEGICLPDDHESLEFVKFDIEMQNERLNTLLQQEVVVKEMIAKNEAAKEGLNIRLTKLHAAERQCEEDETNLGKECLRYAKEVEKITNDVVNTVSTTLNVYANCGEDKESAKRFYAYGPFDQYRQTQAMFRSHFDLFASKKFINRDNNINEEDLQTALYKAQNLETRLTESIISYIETKAELSGEQAKLSLVANYTNVHPSQMQEYAMEARSTIDLLEQDETILEQQIQNATRQLVDRRTNLAVETIAKTALGVRIEIQKSLKFLLDVSQQALAVDKLLYTALRTELTCVEELLHFASDLKDFLDQDADAVHSRIRSMNDICTEHSQAERNLLVSDILMNSLCKLYGIDAGDAASLFKANNELEHNIRNLNDSVLDRFSEKEAIIVQIKKEASPLKRMVWSGASKQAQCVSANVSLMLHTLTQQMELCNRALLHSADMFTTVKNGDKHNQRKLWQWFLTDQGKLLAAVKQKL